MITRRGLLGLALSVIPGAKLLADILPRMDPDEYYRFSGNLAAMGGLEQPEEYEIGYEGFEPLVVKVWSNWDVFVSKGAEQLIQQDSDDEWLEFLGKYGTRISLRIGRQRELEVGYFAIVEPRGPDVEDVDYLAPGQYEKFGFPCNV
jgi:hypothetical protein